MSNSYVFIKNNEILAVYQDFDKFRRETFHYMLSFLVSNKQFKTKLEAGTFLKSELNKFYGKDKKQLEFKENKWECKVFKNNCLEKEGEKKEEENNYTKIIPKKIATSTKVLSKDLHYVKLDDLYGK